MKKQKQKKHKEITLDNLAVIVAKGFENTATKVDVDNLKSDMHGLKSTVARLEQGQEEIKLKLDNVAYRFELQELQRRVVLLEKKARIAR